MSSSFEVPVNIQARTVLHTLCNFILPLVQIAVGQTFNSLNVEEMSMGIEADEFVSALENFISGMIMRSQPGGKDIGIEVTLDDTGIETEWPDGLEEVELITGPDTEPETQGNICIFIPDGEATLAVDENSNDRVESDRIPGDPSLSALSQIGVVSQSPISVEDDPILKHELGVLKDIVFQRMPIRLLHFEQHTSNLKITLMERGDIYDYLAPILRAHFFTEHRFGLIGALTSYAILSHTWTQTPGELTYGDWQKGSLSAEQSKCQKLVNFCKTAWEKHRLNFGWIDTVCINKESSAELDESIRSMYAWYSRSTVCITYLGRTTSLQDMHNDPWFSRGWTLQELLAPRDVKFYNMRWKQLLEANLENDKKNPAILESIQRATTIQPHELQEINSSYVSISRKMQLAAMRKVTREEDMAYSLMGIFNVSISIAYGEGAERAFFRLLKGIFDRNKDVSDIFNWGSYNRFNWRYTSLFPSSPSNYLRRSFVPRWYPIKPLILTHLGLRTPILLMPAESSPKSVMGWNRPIGDYYATVSINLSMTERKMPMTYHLLDKRVTRTDDLNSEPTEQMPLIFGVLNVEAYGTKIRIFKSCFAVCLRWNMRAKWAIGPTLSPKYIKENTQEPVVFELEKYGNNSDDNSNNNYYQIERSLLESHGMQLVTLDL